MDSNNYQTLTEEQKKNLRMQRFALGDTQVNTVGSIKVISPNNR